MSAWLGLRQLCPLAFALLVSVAMSAFAQSPCSIRVQPASAEQGWREVARQAIEQLESIPSTQQDCRDIVLDVQRGGGALVAITTTDGRRAARPVAAPEDVVPTVRALLVTLPPLPPPRVPPLPPSGAEPPKRAESSDTEPANAADVLGSGEHKPHAFLTVAGGERTAVGQAIGSPAATASVGALVGRFELGAFGSREFAYAPLGGSSPQGFSMAATSFGVFGGFRARIASLALIAGLQLGASLVRERVDGASTQVDATGNGDSQDTLVPGSPVTYGPTDARTGIYVAAVVPLRFRVRLRPQVGLDVVALRSGSMPTGSALLAVPRWAAAFTLALEGTVL